MIWKIGRTDMESFVQMPDGELAPVHYAYPPSGQSAVVCGKFEDGTFRIGFTGPECVERARKLADFLNDITKETA